MDLLKKIIGLLSVCTAGIFNRLLTSNSEERVKYVSLNNRLCQARPTLVNINLNETLFYPFTVANIINDPYAQVCGPNKVKNMNVEVFHLISAVN